MEEHTPGIDIEIHWGKSVLHVAHLAPPRSVYVGESRASCDCQIPAALLGAKRAPLIIVDQSGSTWLAVLPGATGTIAVGDQPEASLQASPSTQSRAPHLVPFPPGSRATLEIGDLTIRASSDLDGPVPARGGWRDPSAPLHVGISLVAHVCLLIASAFAMPPLSETPNAHDWEEPEHRIVAQLTTVTEREQDPPIIEPSETIDPDDRERVESRCGEHDGGSMGAPNAAGTRHRYGIQGPSDNADPHVARQASYRDAWESSIGLSTRSSGGDPNAPTVAWGRDDSLGNDAYSAHGNMWGDEIGEASGSPGVGLGRDQHCATCGDHGRGKDRGLTFAGGPTRTESTFDLAVALALH